MKNQLPTIKIATALLVFGATATSLAGPGDTQLPVPNCPKNTQPAVIEKRVEVKVGVPEVAHIIATQKQTTVECRPKPVQEHQKEKK